MFSVTHLFLAPNPCAAKDGKEPCSHLCLINYNQTFSCACPHLMKLGPDKRTCYGEHEQTQRQLQRSPLSRQTIFLFTCLGTVVVEYHSVIPVLISVCSCKEEKEDKKMLLHAAAVATLERFETVCLWKVRPILLVQCESLVFWGAPSVIFRGNWTESCILCDPGISLSPLHPLPTLLYHYCPILALFPSPCPSVEMASV